jgi:histidine ammonia-lyase
MLAARGRSAKGNRQTDALFKIQSLGYGHSGIQLQTVNRLVAFFNNDILPVIYTQGSLGASGDLAPLAHLSCLY